MPKTLAVIALAALATTATGQHHGYATDKELELKALSVEEVMQYLSGAGMGYAKPAELNRYPGPMHVLQLADKLHLSPEQRAATERLMEAHKAEARNIGARRVEAERRLERADRALRHASRLCRRAISPMLTEKEFT